ncbi:MAG: hypothetical protein ACRDUT_04770, partial [Mycobacterium sp.]
PPVVVQATVPLTFWSLPSMVTFAAFAPPVATDAPPCFDDVPGPLVVDLLLEHPDRLTTTIAVAAAAIVTGRFTRAPLLLWRSIGTDGPFRKYAA